MGRPIIAVFTITFVAVFLSIDAHPSSSDDSQPTDELLPYINAALARLRNQKLSQPSISIATGVKLECEAETQMPKPPTQTLLEPQCILTKFDALGLDSYEGSHFSMFKGLLTSSSGSTASNGSSLKSIFSASTPGAFYRSGIEPTAILERPNVPNTRFEAREPSAPNCFSMAEQVEASIGLLNTKSYNAQSPYHSAQHHSVVSDRQQYSVSPGSSAEQCFGIAAPLRQNLFKDADRVCTDQSRHPIHLRFTEQQSSQRSLSSVEGCISTASTGQQDLSEVVLDMDSAECDGAFIRLPQTSEDVIPFAEHEFPMPLSSSSSPSGLARPGPGLGLPQQKMLSPQAANVESAEILVIQSDSMQPLPTVSCTEGVVEPQDSLEPCVSLMASSCGSCGSSDSALQSGHLQQQHHHRHRDGVSAGSDVIRNRLQPSDYVATQWSAALENDLRSSFDEQESDWSEVSSQQLDFIGCMMPPARLALPIVKNDDSLSLRKFEHALMRLSVTNEFAILCARLTSFALHKLSQWDGSTGLNDYLEENILRFLESSILNSDSLNRAMVLHCRFPYLSNESDNFAAISNAVLDICSKQCCFGDLLEIIDHCDFLHETAREFLESRRRQFEKAIQRNYISCINHMANQIHHLTNQDIIDIDRLIGEDSEALRLVSDCLNDNQAHVDKEMSHTLLLTKDKLRELYLSEANSRAQPIHSHPDEFFEKVLLPYDDVFKLSGQMLNMLNRCVSAASEATRSALASAEGAPFDVYSIVRPTLSHAKLFHCDAFHRQIAYALTKISNVLTLFVKDLAITLTSTLKDHAQLQCHESPVLVKRRMNFIAHMLKILLRNHILHISGSWRNTIECAIDEMFARCPDPISSDCYKIIGLPLSWWVRESNASIDRALAGIVYD